MMTPSLESSASGKKKAHDSYRLKLSVEEARQLFNQIHQEVQNICQESCQPSQDSKNGAIQPADSSDQFDEIWPLVDEEIRRTFELCRYGLDVEGVDVMDVEEFRGFCEDFDGVEPIDHTLFSNLSEKVTEINRLMEVRSMSRTKLPRNIKTMFRQHVADERQQLDAMLDQKVPPVDIKDHESAIADIVAVPPSELGTMAKELTDKLAELRKLAEIAVPSTVD